MKILIVDDSPIMRNIVRNTLKNLKYSLDDTHDATDGEDAWRLIFEIEPDVVFLDWNMPGLNGFELLTRIRKDERYSKIPVIMATSLSDKTHVVQAIKAGATDYIIKPVREEQVQEKLMRIQDHILLSRL